MTSALEVTLPLATSIVSAVSPFETDLVKSACATTDDARVAGRTGSSTTEVAAAAAAASRATALGLRSDTVCVLTPIFCHGRAGSQQPTLPAVQPTVHRAQHVDVANGGRGATHLVDCLTQHTVQAPLQPGLSWQHDSVAVQNGAAGSEPHCCASTAGARRTRRATRISGSPRSSDVESSQRTTTRAVKCILGRKIQ